MTKAFSAGDEKNTHLAFQKAFTGRLRQLMDERSITQVELGRVVGVSQTTVSRWLAGSMPTKPHIKSMAVQYDLDEFWLLTGQGRKELTLAERRLRDEATEERTKEADDYVEKTKKPRRVIYIQRDTSSHRDVFRFDRASEEDWAFIVQTVKEYCLKVKTGDRGTS